MRRLGQIPNRGTGGRPTARGTITSPGVPVTTGTEPELVRGSVALRSSAPHRYALVAVAAVLLGLLALAVWQLTQNGASRVVSQTRSVAPFSAVELAGSNIVTVRVGARQSGQSVIVHAHANMLDHITTQVVTGHLVIGDAHTRQATKGPVSVSVGVPSLKSVTIPHSGSGIITATGINTPSFRVTLAGSGILRASGTATRLNVTIGGSGDVELDQLVSRDALAVVSGSGRIVITATRSLNASVTGDGVIQYGGNPAGLTTSVTGNGVIIPGATG
jgi:Putative auto-transporter adhesin, head GIN domain